MALGLEAIRDHTLFARPRLHISTDDILKVEKIQKAVYSILLDFVNLASVHTSNMFLDS